MKKEQMNRYAYELMVKNNPDEAVNRLMLLDKIQDRNNNAIDYITKECVLNAIDYYGVVCGLNSIKCANVLSILIGDKDE